MWLFVSNIIVCYCVNELIISISSHFVQSPSLPFRMFELSTRWQRWRRRRWRQRHQYTFGCIKHTQSHCFVHRANTLGAYDSHVSVCRMCVCVCHIYAFATTFHKFQSDSITKNTYRTVKLCASQFMYVVRDRKSFQMFVFLLLKCNGSDSSSNIMA